MTNVNIPKKDNPVLLDKAIQDLQRVLPTKIAWLNFVFGRAYRLVKTVNDAEQAYPGVYVNNSEYLSVLPDDNLGNFVFFEVNDPQEVLDGFPSQQRLKVQVSIIFWYNLNSINSNADTHLGEDVKFNILKVFTKNSLLRSGYINILRLHEKAENIYKGYSLKEVGSQYLMHPYAGIRIDCELILQELC